MSLITIHSPEEAEQCKQLDRFTERIRERAHSLFERRSGAEGHALDDWLQAEQELLFTPAMSREDRDDELVLQADMAQFRPKEIHIDITAEAIIVTAEHALKANGKEVVKQCVARFDLETASSRTMFRRSYGPEFSAFMWANRRVFTASHESAYAITAASY